MKLIAKSTIYGLKKDPQKPTAAGEIFECDDETRLSLLKSDSAEEFIEGEEADNPPSALTSEQLADAKTDLIFRISTAATAGTLDVIVPDDEADADVLAALDTRLKELEPNH
jgi:hypothetical protein